MATDLQSILAGLQGQQLSAAQLAALMQAGFGVQGQQSNFDPNAGADLPSWVSFNPGAGGFVGGTPTSAQISTPLGSIGEGGAFGNYSLQLVQNPDGSYSIGSGAPAWNASANNGSSTLLDRFGDNLDWIGPLAIAAATYGAGAGAAGAGEGASTAGNALGTTGSDWASGLATTGGEWGTTGYNLLGTPELAIGQGSYAAPAAAGAVTSSVGAAPAVASGAGTGATSTMSDAALRNAAFGDPSLNSPSVPSSGGGLLSQLLSSPAAGPLAGAAIGALAGSQDSTTTNSTQVDPALAAYMQQYRDLASQTAAIPFEAYTGQRVAGLSPEQQAAGSAMQSQVDSIPALRAQISSLIGQGTTPLSAAQNSEMDQVRQMLTGLTQAKTAAVNPYADASNPYLQGAITAANRGLVDNYNTAVAPKYSQGSSFGNSGLAEYEALDRANLARQLSDNANTLSYQGYNQAAQLAEQGAQRQDDLTQLAQKLGLAGAQVLGQLGDSAASRADQVASGNATRALQGSQIAANSETQLSQLMQNLLGYGNTVQATNQAGLDAQYEEFLRRIQYPQQQLSILGQGLNANPGSTSSSTTPGNIFTGAAGGTLLGAQVQRLLSQPSTTGSSSGTGLQQVVSSPTYNYSGYSGTDFSSLFGTQNSKNLFGTTVGN